MKILYLLNYLGSGGTESYVYSLAKGLLDNNEIYLAYNVRSEGYDKFKKLGIKMLELNMDSPYDLRAAKKLKSFCQDNSIDIIHTQFLRENSIAVLSRLMGNKAEVINTRHMLLKNTGPARFVNKIITSFNKSIIAVSESVRDLLIKELSTSKNIELIYTGIDLSGWGVSNYNLREKYGINKDTVIIASTARLSAEKGHKFIINSLTRLKKELDHSNFIFLFIGSGPLLEELKDLTREKNLESNILFLGYQEDVRTILNQSDIFLLASELEAFGISILEAMASKLPVITTDSGGTTEIIPRDSKVGLVIEYGNIDQLVGQLKKLISRKDLRQFYGEEGFKLVSQHFSLEKTINETYRLYSK